MTYNDIWHGNATRRARFLTTLTILLGCAPSCSSNAAAEPSPAGSARSSVLDATLGDGDPSPEISTAEFQAVLRDPTVVVLDARPPAEYAVSSGAMMRVVTAVISAWPASACRPRPS